MFIMSFDHALVY